MGSTVTPFNKRVNNHTVRDKRKSVVDICTHISRGILGQSKPHDNSTN